MYTGIALSKHTGGDNYGIPGYSSNIAIEPTSCSVQAIFAVPTIPYRYRRATNKHVCRRSRNGCAHRPILQLILFLTCADMRAPSAHRVRLRDYVVVSTSYKKHPSNESRPDVAYTDASVTNEIPALSCCRVAQTNIADAQTVWSACLRPGRPGNGGLQRMKLRGNKTTYTAARRMSVLNRNHTKYAGRTPTRK